MAVLPTPLSSMVNGPLSSLYSASVPSVEPPRLYTSSSVLSLLISFSCSVILLTLLWMVTLSPLVYVCYSSNSSLQLPLISVIYLSNASVSRAHLLFNSSISYFYLSYSFWSSFFSYLIFLTLCS